MSTPTFNELFGIDPARQAANASGNAMIAAMRDSKASRPISLLTGETSTSSVQPPEVAERAARALSESEAAKRSGDPERIAYAEFALDQAIEASRTSRAAAEQARDEHGQFAPSFDGGVRGRKRNPAAQGRQPESSNTLFRRMIEASRAENREAQTEQTLHTSGIASTIRHNR